MVETVQPSGRCRDGRTETVRCVVRLLGSHWATVISVAVGEVVCRRVRSASVVPILMITITCHTRRVP